MSAHKTKGKKRKSQDDVKDISTSHDIVAPYEICDNALGLLNFLVSGYLFDDQSFTSLYNKSLNDEWDKIFINEQKRLKRIKPNENSVVKCFLLNRLLRQYSQDRNGFNQQVKNLRLEIDSRMISTIPQWRREDLFREIRRWRDIQYRRHLFHFSHEGENQMPTFLMLQKATTNWCETLMNHCRQNKNFLDNGGRDYFIELFEHSFIIVAQPTGPYGVPVADYARGNHPSSEKFAKINVRIICLLNLDVLQNDVELSNIDVRLCSLNQSINNISLKQTPIAWETQQVMSTDSGPISIRYAELHNLILNNLYSRRDNTTPDSNLYQLIFQTRIQVVFNLHDKKNSIFEYDTQLISQPFGISSHSTYFPDTLAKVVYYEIEQISKNEGKMIDPDILTEYTCRYQTRMLGVKTKAHTIQYIKEVFSKAFADVKNNDTAKLRLLIEERLAQLISQIKFMVDYPVLAMMYDDSLFLGICNNSEVDKKLKGTPKKPQMLLRFKNLLCHQCNETPEIRCMIHDGTLEKTTFSTKAFIDDMCRFIYESADNTERETAIFSYSDIRTFNDFQWYYNQLIPVLSKILPARESEYKPLIPVLWQLRAKSEHHVDDNLQLQSNRVTTGSPPSSSSNLTNDPLTITYRVNQQNLQNKSTAITFDLNIPVAVDIDPDVIVQYLKEKFQGLCKIQDETSLQTDSIQSLPPLNITDENTNEETDASDNELYDDPIGPLRTPMLQTDSEFDFVDGNISPFG